MSDTAASAPRAPTEDGPSGWHNDSLDKGIRSFQRENALKIDGLLKPGGPTITALGGRLGGKASEQTGAKTGILPGLHDGMEGIGGPLGQAKPPKPDEPRLPHFPTPPRLDTPEARLQALFDIAPAPWAGASSARTGRASGPGRFCRRPPRLPPPPRMPIPSPATPSPRPVPASMTIGPGPC